MTGSADAMFTRVRKETCFSQIASVVGSLEMVLKGLGEERTATTERREGEKSDSEG
jgi:hypothetical protein